MMLVLLIGIALIIYYASKRNLFDTREKISTSYCNQCGSEIKDNYLYCPNCKKQLKKECEECGKLIDVTWRHCPYCNK